MASSKDTFESGTFLASTFACGTFRGIGADILSPTQPGLEHTLPENRMHHTHGGGPMHHTHAENRMHHTMNEEN